MDKCLYVVNVEAAIFKGDKWLLGQRSAKEDHDPGLFSMIGGKVENVEAENHILEKTLKREVLEEVGVEVQNNIHYVKSSSFIADFGRHVVDIVFLCEYKAGQATVLEQDELDSVEWMTIDELLAHEKIGPYTKESLKIAEQMRLNR